MSTVGQPHEATMSPRLPTSGNIAFTVLPQTNGACVCESVIAFEDRATNTLKCLGQSPNHAIAISLETLARSFRKEAEKEQHLDWEVVEELASGQVVNQRYHIILHYERVAEEESKFEAMHNTLLGNSVIENAEITIVRIEAELPMNSWK